MLLGEYINADYVDYQDCKKFQITCPNCKEPIFKAYRKDPPPGIHYLSHYEKDKAYVAECELRVSRINTNVMQDSNKVSRDQKLEYFLSVLKEALIDRFCFEDHVFSVEDFNKPELKVVLDKFVVKKEVSMIINASGPQLMRDFLFASICKWPIERIELLINKNLDFETQERGLVLTGFALDIQKRIAKDIFTHLLTHKTFGNFSYLFGTSYLREMIRWEKLIELTKDENFNLTWQTRIGASLRRLTKTSVNKSKLLLNQLMTETFIEPNTNSEVTYLQKIYANLTNEMCVQLGQLPYFDILKTAEECA
jgi:hypothetical protein